MDDNIKIEIVTISDYHKIFNLIKKNISNKNICIQIKKSFLEPLDVLLLTQSIIYFKKNNCEIQTQHSKMIDNYFDSIRIVDFCKANYKESSTIEVIPSVSAMPIRRVSEENMNEYIEATKQYFSSICNDKDLTMLNSCLSELINNVYNHSYSSTGAYVFSQYYPKNNEIKFAVSDLGIGIPESINNYMMLEKLPKLTNIDCVKWAMEENNTTQSIPQNKGKGLNNISSFVKSNKSEMKLLTNGVRTQIYKSGKSNNSSNPIFNQIGTIIQVTINVSNLENIEIVEEFDW